MINELNQSFQSNLGKLKVSMYCTYIVKEIQKLIQKPLIFIVVCLSQETSKIQKGDIKRLIELLHTTEDIELQVKLFSILAFYVVSNVRFHLLLQFFLNY